MNETQLGLDYDTPDNFYLLKADPAYHEWLDTLSQHLENTMPRVSEMIQSKFLRKEDFDEDQVVTIKTVKLEEMQTTSDSRWVLYFNELVKGMVLNTTTIRVLEAAYGDDSDSWLGKKVMVYVDPNVSFQGRVVGGLRLRTPKKPLTTKPSVPVTEPEFNDEVPF